MSQTSASELVVVGAGEEPLFSDEWANTLTHGFGFLLSAGGVFPFIIVPSYAGDTFQFIGATVYATTLVLLYGASTLYHGTQDARLKKIFKTCDYIGIYLLIAGTYTPFMLTLVRGPWGWALLAAVWTFALLGTLARLGLIQKTPGSSAVPYVLMGWLAVLAIGPILRSVPIDCFLWMLAGGLAYTLGVYFYAKRARYFHAIWHLFVLVGSACHFFAVALYVVP